MGKLLEGIKIVELATFIAAPAATRFLADLGAEVIKIEPPKGDPLRYTAPSEGRPLSQEENTTFDLENANKKGICINTKDPKGKEILHKLLAECDVFVTNNRPQALAKQGLDYETFHKMYPKVVYATCTGYGEKGPDKDLPGFDFTSYFARGGYLGTLYPQGSEPQMVVPGLGDHNVGMNLAAGILAAIIHAQKTGEGEKVTSSLFHSALFNIGIMIQAAQYPETGQPYPVDRTKQANPLLSCWKTKDGRYIQTCAPNYDTYYEPLMRALGREDLVGNEKYFPIKNLVENNLSQEMYFIIKDEMEKKTVEELTKVLTEVDMPFAKAQLWEEILEDEQAWANDYLMKMDYPSGEKALVRPPVLFENMGLPEVEKAPLLGKDNEEVLKELGYSDDEIKNFKEAGVTIQW